MKQWPRRQTKVMHGQGKKQQNPKNILEMVFIGFGDEMDTRIRVKVDDSWVLNLTN